MLGTRTGAFTIEVIQNDMNLTPKLLNRIRRAR